MAAISWRTVGGGKRAHAFVGDKRTALCRIGGVHQHEKDGAEKCLSCLATIIKAEVRDDHPFADKGGNTMATIAGHREGQPKMVTITGYRKDAGLWYSPAAVAEMIAAEREACAKVCEAEATEAFGEGADEWGRAACTCAALIRTETIRGRK